MFKFKFVAGFWAFVVTSFWLGIAVADIADFGEFLKTPLADLPDCSTDCFLDYVDLSKDVPGGCPNFKEYSCFCDDKTSAGNWLGKCFGEKCQTEKDREEHKRQVKEICPSGGFVATMSFLPLKTTSEPTRSISSTTETPSTDAPVTTTSETSTESSTPVPPNTKNPTTTPTAGRSSVLFDNAAYTVTESTTPKPTSSGASSFRPEYAITFRNSLALRALLIFVAIAVFEHSFQMP